MDAAASTNVEIQQPTAQMFNDLVRSHENALGFQTDIMRQISALTSQISKPHNVSPAVINKITNNITNNITKTLTDGWNMIAPQSVHAGGSIGWTTANAGAFGVPNSATHAILQGDVNTGSIDVRSDVSGYTYRVVESVGSGNRSVRSMMTVPLSGLNFDYSFNSVSTGTLYIIGYITKQLGGISSGGGGGGSTTLSGLADVGISGPADGDILEFVSASAKWQNFGVSGDLTANAGVFTFNTVNSNVGTFPSDAAHVPSLTVNGKGLITAISSVAIAINGNQITSGVVGTTYGGTGLNAIGTADQVLAVNHTATGLEYKTVQGTTNQVSVALAAGTITLSTPQNIHTGASPTFVGLNLSGLTASLPVVTDASKNLASVSYSTFAGNLTAAGDVTGALNATTVAKINGVTLGSTAATDKNILIANGTSWVSQTVSGDITIGNTGVTALANVITAGGPQGDSSHTQVLTWDAKGRLLTVTNTAIGSLNASVISAGTLALARGGTNADLSGTGGAKQYLKQSTLGGNISVGTLPLTDTTGGTQGRVPYDDGTNAAWLAVGTSGQLLVTQGASANPKWDNIANYLTAGSGISLSGTTNVTITSTGTASLPSGSTGAMLYNTTGSTTYAAEATSALMWDHTNGRLGIGTASPTVALQVANNASFLASGGTLVRSGTVGYRNSGQFMGSFRGGVLDSTTYHDGYAINAICAENQDATHMGTSMQFQTVPAASTTLTTRLTINADGTLVAGGTLQTGGYISSDGSSGVSVTVALAKLTTGGAQGTMTVKNGIVTAYSAPT